MQTLKLDVDTLKVNSFEVGAAEDAAIPTTITTVTITTTFTAN